MTNLVLYVKSKKISVGRGSNITSGMHSVDDSDYTLTVFSRANASGTSRTFGNFSMQDQEAIDLLNEAKIAYELIDLTERRFMTRLKARISGIKTPTLVCDGEKISGIENIKQALKDLRAYCCVHG